MSETGVKWTKAAVMCFYAALIACLALYDEKLDPEPAKIMAELPEVMEPGNAWIAFIGFEAPPGMSPFAYGEDKVRKHREALRQGKNRVELPKTGDVDESLLRVKGKIPSFSRKEGGTLSYAAAHPEDVAALVRNNEELLRRYEGLANYPRYNESSDFFSGLTPNYLPIRKAYQMRLLTLADKAVRGDVEAALTGLRKDAEFWRMVARSPNSLLISKMVTYAVFSMQLPFTAELAASRPLNDTERQLVDEILRPFDKGETTGILGGEFRVLLKYLDSLLQAESFPTATLRKRNASLNRFYSLWQSSLFGADLSPRQFALERKNLEEGLSYRGRMDIPFLYNPAGEAGITIIWAIAQANFLPYVLVAHDMEALRRLCLLKVMARRERIPPEGMRQFLDAHKKGLGNPYTEGPMTWNPERSTISCSIIAGRPAQEIPL